MAWLWDLGEDLRFGVRLLRKSPGFATVAILTLAVAIGANSAIFSAVNGIVLQPLPYPDAARLVTVGRFRQIAYGLSGSEVKVIQRQCPAIERAASYTEGSGTIATDTLSVQRPVTGVSGTFFSLLGLKPLLGRTLRSRDAQAGERGRRRC